MEVYLIQHAHSKSKEEDPARPLSDEGRMAIERVAKYCSRLNIAFDRIYHSGTFRAQQTAEILARHLHATDRVEAKQGLDPLDDVRPTQDWLAKQAQQGAKAIALVGHLPFLDRLASLLVARNEAANAVAFRYGGMVKLIPKPQGEGFAVEWVLTPELVTTA